MAKNTDIINELKGISPALAAIDIGQPFNIPENYFQLFPEKMLEKALSQQESADVPEGYFDQFAETMVKQIRSLEVYKELESIAPMLNYISRIMPHFLPEGYFDREIGVPKENKPAKVVSIFGNKIRGWAVAASVIFMLGTGWLLIDQNRKTDDNLSSVSSEEFNSILGKMDETNLDNLIEESAVETGFTELLLLVGQDVEKSLKAVSTDELKYYIDNHNLPEQGI